MHIASSEARGVDMVLDISRETISSNKCELLVVRKRSSSRNATQVWNFRQVSNSPTVCLNSHSVNILVIKITFCHTLGGKISFE